jgi:DNA-binding transcriptional ArsR family regulator
MGRTPRALSCCRQCRRHYIRLTITTSNGAEEVALKFLETITGLSQDNLSSHTAKLEEAGYLEVIKSFRGRRPHTSYRITAEGKAALTKYWEQLRSILPADTI